MRDWLTGRLKLKDGSSRACGRLPRSKHSTIGDMLDAMAEVEAGGIVDWSGITASPALLRMLDQIGEGEGV